MRKYYFFIVKKEYISIYKNKSYVLYKIIEKLYKVRKKDLKKATKLYNSMFLKISVKLLCNYFNSKNYYKLKNRLYKIGSTYIKIMYPCIIVKTNENINSIFKILNIYNKCFFVCDFKNIDYFWLNDFLSKHIYK